MLLSNCVMFFLVFWFFFLTAQEKNRITSICVSTHVAAFKYKCLTESFKDGFSVLVYNLQQCDMLTSSNWQLRFDHCIHYNL